MRSTRTVELIFYGGLLLVMLAIFLQWLPAVLPDATARSVGYNSEGYVLALIIAAWIQFARPRLVDSRLQWPLTVAAALLFAAVGVALLASELPSRFRTLNEAFLAAGLAVLYLQLRRPLPRWLPFVLSGGVLVLTVLFGETTLLTLAEMLGVLVLLPLAVDVFDRRLLERDPGTSPAPAFVLYAALAVVIIALPVLGRVGIGGEVGATIDYVHRMQEAFICVLLVHVYFAVRRVLDPDADPGLGTERDDLPAGRAQR